LKIKSVANAIWIREMKTVFLLVEDKKFIPAIKNYFQYLKYWVRVVSGDRRLRTRKNVPDLLILRVGARSRQVSFAIKKVYGKPPYVKTLYLAVLKDRKLQNAMRKHGIIVMIETRDLYRIYKRVERLRRKRR